MSKISAFVRAMRPTQWTKNVFVLAGLLFNESAIDAAMLLSVLLAFAAFCLLASAIYIVNDIRDIEEDRTHETKRHRPIASGALSVTDGWVFAGTLLAGSLVLGYLASGYVLLVLGTYLVLNLGYSFGLKRVVILDVFIIASGFLLRILAGTIGVGMEPSEWLFLCSLCLTLFLGFGKRRAELIELDSSGQDAKKRRVVLNEYSPVVLDSMMAAVAACTFVSYGLFAMSDQTAQQHGTRALVYTLPFVMYAMFRYFYLLHVRAKGNDPAEDLVRDPHILVSGAFWLLATYAIIG